MKALVTGGGGFLGSAIVRRLIERGDQVNALQRGSYPELDALGVTSFRGDLGGDHDALAHAAQGCDIVFHTAAKAGVWGSRAEYYQPNYVGTVHALEAARAAGVKHFVYTSSPSVCFHGQNESGVNESIEYPATYLTAYPWSKALAEAQVLEQNDDELTTVALRPHLIWGPRDPHLVPRVIERAKAGKLKLVGNGKNRVDATYIDNAAEAHIAAGDCLLRDGSNAPCAGKAYFISNDEPIAMGELLNRILAAGDLPPVKKSVSPGIAYAAGSVLEVIYHILGKNSEPIMTRFVAKQLSTEHWYDLSAAKSDFGYSPSVSMDEGMDRLAEWLKQKP